MTILYRLTDNLGPIDQVDALGRAQESQCVCLPKGTEFRIFRKRHKWAVAPGAPEFDYYTIHVRGVHYNVLANQLEPSMEQVEPPVLKRRQHAAAPAARLGDGTRDGNAPQRARVE